MKKTILITIAFILIVVAVTTAHPYSGLNQGIAWDFGGIEIKGQPGIFLCADSYNATTGTSTHNFTADLFPSLVVDC